MWVNQKRQKRKCTSVRDNFVKWPSGRKASDNSDRLFWQEIANCLNIIRYDGVRPCFFFISSLHFIFHLKSLTAYLQTKTSQKVWILKWMYFTYIVWNLGLLNWCEVDILAQSYDLFCCMNGDLWIYNIIIPHPNSSTCHNIMWAWNQQIQDLMDKYCPIHPKILIRRSTRNLMLRKPKLMSKSDSIGLL